MIHIINRLLQGDNVPFSRNLLFNCAFFAKSRSWIPTESSREQDTCQHVTEQRNFVQEVHRVVPNDFVWEISRLQHRAKRPKDNGYEDMFERTQALPDHMIDHCERGTLLAANEQHNV